MNNINDNGAQLLPRALLQAAADLERAEARIRAAILEAARAGDTALVVSIIEKWNAGAVDDVVKFIEAGRVQASPSKERSPAR